MYVTRARICSLPITLQKPLLQSQLLQRKFHAPMMSLGVLLFIGQEDVALTMVSHGVQRTGAWMHACFGVRSRSRPPFMR